ncbi:MAG: class I SAM-dependent methyltransferase [Candidatus Helarchaeota archaeon]|nr:class I SAM-dependent methyltransferase [Candidatus Helarchaeota archaeon]
MVQRKKEVIKHFDAWSASYEQEVWTRDKYFHEMIESWVLKSISKIEEQKILELGVGPGIYAKKFLERTNFVINVDISYEMLKIAKNNLEKDNDDNNLLNFVLADAQFLPFRNNIFDIINCIEVLRHLPQPYKIIWTIFIEMHRVITKHGSILITIPNILFPLNLLWIFYYKIPLNFLRLFHKKIGYHYDRNASFPHFPVLYNEPEDHMYNFFFLKKLIRKFNLNIFQFLGNFFFPACPKILFPIFKKINKVLGRSPWKFLAYSFLIKLERF